MGKEKKNNEFAGEEFAGQKFCSLNYSGNNINGKSFYNCSFDNCSFSDAVIESCIFDGCVFTSSDLSMTRFSHSKIPGCSFEKSRLKGIDWSPLGSKIGLKLNIKDSDLSYSTFIDMELSESRFLGCRIHEADFTRAILKKSSFKGSDLLRTVFKATDLREADLRDAYNYSFDPGQNKCEGTKLSHLEAINLLKAYGIIVE